jgi:hypothetical protein
MFEWGGRRQGSGRGGGGGAEGTLSSLAEPCPLHLLPNLAGQPLHFMATGCCMCTRVAEGLCKETIPNPDPAAGTPST